MEGFHPSVLLQEVIDGLNCRNNPGTYVDGTLGDGGHSQAILEAHPQNKVIGIDQDHLALERAKRRLKDFSGRVEFAEANFSEIEAVLKSLRIERVNGILLDLGFSSFQIETPSRGFSFLNDAPLDMRMSNKRKVSAADLVNRLSAGELQDIFSKYGEEKFSGRIARAIVKNREISPITTTGELVEIIREASPAAYRYDSKIHFATRVFQALRIAVNDEIEVLKSTLPSALNFLSPRGRLALISFHSLEDREVKAFFRQESALCVCPPRIPICRCGTHPKLKIVTKKPIVASPDEIEENPRSRSAKLRVAEKLEE